jgi:hypothetical protein
MKKTHQIGLMTALLASLAFAPYPQNSVPSASTPAASGAAFRSSVRPNPVKDLPLTPLGVRLAYSFGM